MTAPSSTQEPPLELPESEVLNEAELQARIQGETQLLKSSLSSLRSSTPD